MPPATVFDLSKHDLNHVAYDMEFVRTVNAQRGDMEQLNGIIWSGPEGAIAFKDVKADEFWVPGHIPGRPILPGVLMIEAAAQAASFFMATQLHWDGFIGFGGVDEVKFRQAVFPGSRMYILVFFEGQRHGRCNCRAQAVVNGNIVFEGRITGTRV